MLEWSYPTNRAEIYAALTASRVVDATNPPGAKPFSPDFPWAAATPTQDVSDEERLSLKSELRSTSAFGQIRTEAIDG